MKKYLFNKLIKYQKGLVQKELTYYTYKSIKTNKKIDSNVQLILKCMYEGKRLRNFNWTKIRHRCIYNNNSQSYYKFFGLSRWSINKLLGRKVINHLRKSSW